MMKSVPLTALEPWLSQKLAMEGFTALPEYQLDKINKTLRQVEENSSFYKARLKNSSSRLSSLSDLDNLPFTTQEDLKAHHQELVCVSGQYVSRIVTLFSSGSSDLPKRVYFTQADQERIIDFFQHGMMTFCKANDRVLILLPGSIPGTVGDLLSQGLLRLGAVPKLAELSKGYEGLREDIQEFQADFWVVMPHVAAVLGRIQQEQPFAHKLKGMLVTADFLPDSLEKRLEGLFKCPVFQHYGATEAGLGGAVSCQAREGYHIRASDLYFEIIDPWTGKSLGPGKWGELVMTTLNRQAMPLLRYRTGDWGMLAFGKCPCGSLIPRIKRLGGRLEGQGEALAFSRIAEIIFSYETAIDYKIILWEDNSKGAGKNHFKLEVSSLDNLALLEPLESELAALGIPPDDLRLYQGLPDLSLSKRGTCQ